MLRIDYNTRIVTFNGKFIQLGKIETKICKTFEESKNNQVSLLQIIHKAYGISELEFKSLTPRMRCSIVGKARKIVSRVRDRLASLVEQDWIIPKRGTDLYYFSETDLLEDLLRSSYNVNYLHTRNNRINLSDRLLAMEETPSYFKKTFTDNVNPTLEE